MRARRCPRCSPVFFWGWLGLVSLVGFIGYRGNDFSGTFDDEVFWLQMK